MIQEEKDLLIKDLSMRLPYGVIGQCEIDASYDTSFDTIFQTHKFNAVVYGLKSDLLCVTPLIEDEVEQEFAIEEVADGINILDFKPYLFPLSSMTREQKIMIRALQDMGPSHYHSIIDHYNKWHLDYRGLIGKGLANDATGLNIY
jgi:hypothetical protein